jgi:spermidine/putrescine transport system permease protein
MLSTLFGLPAAIALDRSDFPGKALFRRIVLLPIVLPGVITGVSLLLFYVRIGIPLSLNTIILGQGTGLMCITITEVFARLQQVGRRQEEAALNMGANQWEVFTRVTLPSISSALFGAMLITFSISFDEIAVTYLLTGRENTLPMQLWSLLRRTATPDINAVGTLIIAASIVLILTGVWLSRRKTI